MSPPRASSFRFSPSFCLGGMQMVQPLRGAHGFKETGRYSPGVATGPQQLGLRLAAFPFIGELYCRVQVADAAMQGMPQ